MEFGLLDLNQLLISLSNVPTTTESTTHGPTSKSRPSTTEQNNVDMNLNQQQQQTSSTTVPTGDRRYCLIIFNNPSWSQRLRKQPQQRQPNPSNQAKDVVVKSEVQENVSVDDLFIAQLRQLIRDYMQRTTRPFPLKYFLDFTEH